MPVVFLALGLAPAHDPPAAALARYSRSTSSSSPTGGSSSGRASWGVRMRANRRASESRMPARRLPPKPSTFASRPSCAAVSSSSSVSMPSSW